MTRLRIPADIDPRRSTGAPQPMDRQQEPENPPAFPSVCLNDPGHPESVPGMSLRDWFAGQALAGAIACPTMRQGMQSGEYASMSYALADAMLAERKTGGAA